MAVAVLSGSPIGNDAPLTVCGSGWSQRKEIHSIRASMQIRPKDLLLSLACLPNLCSGWQLWSLDAVHCALADQLIAGRIRAEDSIPSREASGELHAQMEGGMRGH